MLFYVINLRNKEQDDDFRSLLSLVLSYCRRLPSLPLITSLEEVSGTFGVDAEDVNSSQGKDHRRVANLLQQLGRSLWEEEDLWELMKTSSYEERITLKCYMLYLFHYLCRIGPTMELHQCYIPQFMEIAKGSEEFSEIITAIKYEKHVEPTFAFPSPYSGKKVTGIQEKENLGDLLDDFEPYSTGSWPESVRDNDVYSAMILPDSDNDAASSAPLHSGTTSDAVTTKLESLATDPRNRVFERWNMGTDRLIDPPLNDESLSRTRGRRPNSIMKKSEDSLRTDL
ncbi:hypothetical protein E1B28_011654 [Marasmius oreades]|uniref:Uncharacterized protein n=1 Tax=Marasmius oreades TaxID=181124 RepID=A0A9P7USB7_9AGAR|nr:uncharacterized protein E1B28_011654 [Marasmius oreades]KAG7090034.1 hypothetical protein E1B28_011654 [Marasmius oreades]